MGLVIEPARAPRLHPDLDGDRGGSFYGALIVFGLPGLAALASAAWVALAPDRKDALGAAVSSAFMGCMLLLAFYLAGARSVAWYRRCSDVYYGRRPVQMRVHTLRNDRGALFLELHSVGDPHMLEPRIRIHAQDPRWDTSGLDGRVASVYLDDDPKGPVVVETEQGRIWPAPLSRRENRVEGKLG
jgi:hypothetical protein